MAEFCLECLNEISGTNYTEADFILSREPDFCENCGKMVRVVVKRRRPIRACKVGIRQPEKGSFPVMLR